MKRTPLQKTLITGGTGFVGSRLAAHLVALGCEPHVVVREQSDLSPLAAIRDRLHVHVHDGGYRSMAAIVERAEPQVVFHLASLFLASHTAADVEPLIRSNVLFGSHLLQAMADSGRNLLVNTGTSWQHYGGAGYDPVCLYAATKQAFEDILTYYVNGCGLHATTLKLFDTYGPGDPRPKLFRLLRRAAASGERLAMSPGEQLVDLVHVDDAVDAFVRAGELLLAGELTGMTDHAVSSGAPLPLRELVARFAKLGGLDLDIEWGGRPYRPREVMTPWSSGAPLPGWAPKTTLDEGLRGLLDAGEAAPHRLEERP